MIVERDTGFYRGNIEVTTKIDIDMLKNIRRTFAFQENPKKVFCE